MGLTKETGLQRRKPHAVRTSGLAGVGGLVQDKAEQKEASVKGFVTMHCDGVLGLPDLIVCSGLLVYLGMNGEAMMVDNAAVGVLRRPWTGVKPMRIATAWVVDTWGRTAGVGCGPSLRAWPPLSSYSAVAREPGPLRLRRVHD